MRIISEKRIRLFCERHANAEAAFREWKKKIIEAEWNSFQDVKKTFASADQVKLKTRERPGRHSSGSKPVVIFNVGGNHFRVIASINYTSKIIYLLFILTHAEYDKNEWKTQL